jgi:hypothetical protein
MYKAHFVAPAILMMCFAIVLNAEAADFVADPPQENWNKVRSLTEGTNLAVQLKGGVRYIGEFVRLGDHSILIKDMDREREFPQSAVSRVSLMRQGSRAKNAAIVGGVVGSIFFGIGCAIAARATDQDKVSGGERMAIGGAMGGIWGGIAAAIAAAHKPGIHEEVIFKSR